LLFVSYPRRRPHVAAVIWPCTFFFSKYIKYQVYFYISLRIYEVLLFDDKQRFLKQLHCLQLTEYTWRLIQLSTFSALLTERWRKRERERELAGLVYYFTNNAF